MLLDANIDSMKEEIKPIIELSDEEVTEPEAIFEIGQEDREKKLRNLGYYEAEDDTHAILL